MQGTASVRRVTSLSFANQQIGVLTDSDSLLFRTSDAGATWEKIDVGNNSLVQAVSLYQEVGVMFCKNDQILTSSDQGITWDSVAAKEFSTVRVNDVLAMDEEHYLVFGGFGASKPIGFSSNAGRTWRYSIPFLSNDQMEFLDAAVASNGAVLLVGNFSTILRSEDGGKNWQVRSNSVLTTNNGQFPYLAGISFATDSIAIAVVAGATDNFSWLKTSDAGTTWQYQRQTLGSVSSIAFLYDL